MTDDPNPAATPSQAPGKPAPRICAVHNLAAAPDGKCFRCRTDASAQMAAAEDDGPDLKAMIMSNLAIFAIGFAMYWALTSGPVDHSDAGPAIEDQIAVVDKQLVELRRMRAAGELDANGLMMMTRVERKRALLQGIKTAQDKNRQR